MYPVIFRLPVLIWLLAVSSFSLSATQLNGLAVSQEFGRDQFIGGLYTTTPDSDASMILGRTEEATIEIKVLLAEMSARTLNSMWIEGLALNSSSSDLEAEAENLAKLMNMFRRRLVAGDTIQIQFVPGNTISVFMNQVELGSIQSEKLFKMLLSSWIGDIPRSTAFKSDLLKQGKVDQQLFDQYESLRPTAARKETVARWIQSDKTESLAKKPVLVEVEKPLVSLPKEIPEVNLAPAEADKKSVEVIAVQKEKVISPVSAQATLIPKKPDSTKSETRVLAEPGSPVVDLKNEQGGALAKNTVKESIESKEESPVDFSEPSEQLVGDNLDESVTTAEDVLSIQRFYIESRGKIMSKVSYPPKALAQGQTGVVNLLVTINNHGELEDIATIENSPFRLLNREAVRAIKSATPFEGVPHIPDGETLTFNAPISFIISD